MLRPRRRKALTWLPGSKYRGGGYERTATDGIDSEQDTEEVELGPVASRQLQNRASVQVWMHSGSACTAYLSGQRQYATCWRSARHVHWDSGPLFAVWLRHQRYKGFWWCHAPSIHTETPGQCMDRDAVLQYSEQGCRCSGPI